jgi:excisionase family DNA binding protein
MLSVERPLLLRVSEVSQILGLSRSAVYGLILSGSLASVKIGRSRRIPRDEVERWVTEQVQVQHAAGGAS